MASRLLAAVLLVSTSVVLGSDRALAHAPHDDISDVAASPEYKTDKTVFALARNRLMRSVDDGATWTQIVRGIDNHIATRLAIAASNKQIMYMSVDDGGVYKSVNQGLSWARTRGIAGMSSHVSALAVSPLSSDVVVAATTAGGLFRTVDGGATWAEVDGAFGAVRAVVFSANAVRLVLGDSSGAVYTSDNDGTTWVRSSGLGGDPISAIGSSSSPASGVSVFVGTQAGLLFRSTNGGSSFSAVGSGLPPNQVMSIGISSTYATDNTMWVSTRNGGVYRSSDRGATVTATSVGLTTDPQADTAGRPDFGRMAVAVDATGRQVLFLDGFNGLFRSDDLAGHWREIQTLTEYVVGLAVSPDYWHDATVITTTYVKGAYVSHDGGTTWKNSSVGLGVAGGNSFAPVFRLTNVRYSPNYRNDGTLFSAGALRVYPSPDRGTSWRSFSVAEFPPGTAQELFVIAISPAYATDRTVYLGSREGVIYRSQADGEEGTWSVLANVGGIVRSLVLSPRFASDHVMYASTEHGIVKSVDAGINWAPTGPAGPAELAISPNYGVDATLFAGTTSGVFVTRDGGDVWTELANAPLSTSTHVEAIQASPSYAADGTVLVSVLGRGLFKSTNGGATFVAVGTSLIANNFLIADYEHPTASPIQFSPTYAVDHTIFGMAEDHIVKSTDGANTWKALNLPRASELLKPPSISAAPTLATVTEGNPGQTVVMQQSFDLSHPYNADVTVQWRTVDVPGDPAFANSAAGDYQARSGTLVFPKGAMRRSAYILVNGDSLDESDEIVVFLLNDAKNATVDGPSVRGLALIKDDDPASLRRAAHRNRIAGR